MLETVFAYPYLVGVFLLFVIWIPFFLDASNRKKLMRIGILFGVLSVIIGQWYSLADYWHPAYVFSRSVPVEDFFYGFFFAGIIASAYSAFRKPSGVDRGNRRIVQFGIVPLTIAVLSFVIFVHALGLNSITAHIAAPFLVGMLVVGVYPHLLKPMLASGGLATVLVFFLFQALLIFFPHLPSDFWYLENLSGVFIAGIPVEEYVFGFSLGFGASFFYEALRGAVPYWDTESV